VGRRDGLLELPRRLDDCGLGTPQETEAAAPPPGDDLI
jgi:hypothetical protein